MAVAKVSAEASKHIWIHIISETTSGESFWRSHSWPALASHRATPCRRSGQHGILSRIVLSARVNVNASGIAATETIVATTIDTAEMGLTAATVVTATSA